MKGDRIIKDISTTFNLNYWIGFQDKNYCSCRYATTTKWFVEIFFKHNRWRIYYYTQINGVYGVKKSIILQSYIKNKRNRVKQFIAEILYYERN